MHPHSALKRFASCVALALLLLPDAAWLSAQEPAPVVPETYQVYKTLVEQARENGTAREMSLDECIQLALRNNLNIEIERYQPLLSQESFLAAHGVYDFTLTSTLDYQKMESPITDTVRQEVLGLRTFKNTTYDWNIGLAKYLPTGGSLAIDFQNNRNSSNTNLFSPLFNADMAFRFTQPLWKNFSIDSSRRSIQRAVKDRTISDIEFENQVSNTIRTVEDAYWDLVNAIESQKIQIQSRELAIIQYRDNKKRVEIGTLAPIVITQTRAEVARSEQSVIAGEADIIRNENLLKNQIGREPTDPIWKQVIIPTDQPTIPEKLIGADEALAQALQNRPEARTMTVQLEKDDIDIKYFANQTKPKLDFQAYYAVDGVAGPNVREPVLDDEGNPVIGPGGQPLYQDTDFTGRLGTAYKQVFQQDYPDYSIALNFEFPLGNETAKANAAIARLSRDQNLSRQRQTLQTIQLEVINAVQTIEVSRRSLDTAIVARQFQEEQLNGETKRFQAGLSTNFEVLQTQRDLAEARNAELAARIDLKKAIVFLQRSTFTNLTQHQLEIAQNR